MWPNCWVCLDKINIELLQNYVNEDDLEQDTDFVRKALEASRIRQQTWNELEAARRESMTAILQGLIPPTTIACSSVDQFYRASLQIEESEVASLHTGD